MKHLFLFLLLAAVSNNIYAQYEYAPSKEHPFGKLNPEAPKETGDYAPLIGTSNCQSESRNPDGSWNSAIDMTWTFQYIMNGTGVQDLTLKTDGTHSGSIRQFNADSAAWYVHYFSSAAATSTLSAWKGEARDGDQFILYKEQTAPNGMEGFYKIVFSDITESSFNWLGSWVNSDETIVYPTWKISCTKQ